jgi:beta-lactam-binding protein with PASTA domain
VSLATRALSALRRIGIMIAIAIAFLFGLATTVYLSLRSSEVTVPDIVGKDRFDAEHVLGTASLNFRVRATRPSSQLKPNTVLFQLPRAGEVVKAGQTVAMDISRAAKEGEATESIAPEKKSGEEKAAENRNTNESASSNTSEDRPKRSKNTNKNGNANRNTNAAANTNSNRTSGNNNANSNRNSNQNENRRPPAPKPLPAAHNTNQENL